jgi:hypothetical protein
VEHKREGKPVSEKNNSTHLAGSIKIRVVPRQHTLLRQAQVQLPKPAPFTNSISCLVRERTSRREQLKLPHSDENDGFPHAVPGLSPTRALLRSPQPARPTSALLIFHSVSTVCNPRLGGVVQPQTATASQIGVATPWQPLLRIRGTGLGEGGRPEGMVGWPSSAGRISFRLSSRSYG